MEKEIQRELTPRQTMLTLSKMFESVAKWFPKRPVLLQIVWRDISRITVKMWRENAEQVKMSAKHLNDPEVRQMIDVLRFSASPHNAMLGLEATLEARAIWQARIEGYSAALNDFESLGVLLMPEHTVEATYSPAELPETEKE